MNFEETNAALVINSAHGIYTGQIFAEMYKNILLRNNYDPEGLKILLSGPDSEEYIQEYAESLLPITLTDDKNQKFVFFEIDGDIWELPEGIYNKVDFNF